jgi:hypothetical protein
VRMIVAAICALDDPRNPELMEVALLHTTSAWLPVNGALDLMRLDRLSEGCTFTKTPQLEARMSALAAHFGKSKFSCKRHCDRRVAGRTQPTDGEGTWTFTPNAPWRACPYRLVVLGTLEDSAGNRLGSHFETSIDSPPGLPVDAVISLAGSRC